MRDDCNSDYGLRRSGAQGPQVRSQSKRIARCQEWMNVFFRFVRGFPILIWPPEPVYLEQVVTRARRARGEMKDFGARAG